MRVEDVRVGVCVWWGKEMAEEGGCTRARVLLAAAATCVVLAGAGRCLQLREGVWLGQHESLCWAPPLVWLGRLVSLHPHT